MLFFRNVVRTVAAGPAFAARGLATEAAPKPRPSTASQLLTVIVPGIVAGGAYYMYTQNQATSALKIKEKLDKAARENPVPALDGSKFLPFALKEVQDVNHNTKRFRFALPSGTTELGLPTASCVVTKFVNGTKPDGKPNAVIRPYTPVEDPADGYTGYFDMIIKKYPNGPMSTHIWSLQPGDTLDIKGPIQKHPYKANEFEKITLLAGGTGITPMIQLIQRVLSNPEDKTKVSLVFANIAEEDILMKDYFDSIAKKHASQVEVRYVLEKPPIGWRGDKGYINEQIIKETAPAQGKGKVFCCGPNQMLEALCGGKAKDFSQGPIGGILKKLGYTEKDVYKF
ncbi:NADH-cytochrome b5 reductase [Geranomyces variabilis]|nr:NADH-cytochrome b5 reductase [Geranomyces variabilis]